MCFFEKFSSLRKCRFRCMWRIFRTDCKTPGEIRRQTAVLVLGAALSLYSCSPRNAASSTKILNTPNSLPTPAVNITRLPTKISTHTPFAETVATVDVSQTDMPVQPQYDDPSYYYGGLRVTLDHVGQEISLKKRQGFMLDLGQDYIWEVTISPEAVVSQNLNYTPRPGEQGIFIARDSGRAELRATGNPLCRHAEPPCTRPDVLYRLTILVE